MSSDSLSNALFGISQSNYSKVQENIMTKTLAASAADSVRPECTQRKPSLTLTIRLRPPRRLPNRTGDNVIRTINAGPQISEKRQQNKPWWHEHLPAERALGPCHQQDQDRKVIRKSTNATTAVAAGTISLGTYT